MPLYRDDIHIGTAEEAVEEECISLLLTKKTQYKFSFAFENYLRESKLVKNTELINAYIMSLPCY